MPILDYTGAAGVFKHLGAIIARVNSYQSFGNTTLPADLQLLLAAFGTTWLPEEGVAAYYEGLRDSVSGFRQSLAGFADRRLLDLETVTRPLGLQPGAGIEETLLALRKAMRDDAQTVRSCLCDASAVSYNAANRGDGRVYLTQTLDGFNAPVNGGIADWSYDGKASELMVPGETMTLECVADSVMDGLAEGGEAWRWSGAPDHGPLDVRTEGSGEGPGILTANQGYNLLQNGALDSWSDVSHASGWTNASGSPQRLNGIVISEPYAAGFGAPCVMRQAVPTGTLQGRRRYWLGFSAYSTAAQPGARVELSLQGTGFAPGAQASIDGSTLTGAVFHHAGAFVTVPSPAPADMVVELRIVNPSAGIWVDELALTPAVYHGGIGVAVQRGQTVWQRGDRATWTVSNGQQGLFQDFFRRWFRAQLPSVAGPPAQGTFLGLLFLLMQSTGSETISESLVA